MNPTVLGVRGPGFLKQVPALGLEVFVNPTTTVYRTEANTPTTQTEQAP